MRKIKIHLPFTLNIIVSDLQPSRFDFTELNPQHSVLSAMPYALCALRSALCAMPSPATRTAFPHLIKGRHPGDILPQYQGVHAGGAFQSTDGFQIAKMADNMMIGQDAPCSGDIPRHARNFDCLANIV